MFKIVTKVILILLYPFFSIFAQNKLEYSKQLSIYDGLAHNGVTSILEDSKGYLWFGTYDGLNRYDGYSLKTFKNTTEKNILVSNRVRTLKEDKNGNLWIGTDEGISIFDYKKQRFKSIYSNKTNKNGIKGPIIREILFNDELEIVICVSEGNGILLFKDDFTFINSYKISDKTNDFIAGIQLDKENYLFASKDGLVSFNIETKIFQSSILGSDKNSLPESSFLIADKENILVTLDYGIGIINYQLINGQYTFKLIDKKLERYNFNNITIDQQNNLWLGTVKEGVLKIDELESFLNNQNYKLSTFSLKDDLTRVSFIDTSTKNGCWIATFNDGVFKFNIDENPFKWFNTKMNYPHAVNSNDIIDISIFDENRVFITASYGGIALFNTKKEAFEAFPFKLKGGNLNGTTAVFVDSDENVWLHIDNVGLCRVRKGETEIKKFVNKEMEAINFYNFRSYTEDKFGNIWICTTDDVYRIEKSLNNDKLEVRSVNTSHPYFRDKKIKLSRKLYSDPSKKFIWLGTDADGLFRFDISNQNMNFEDIKIDQYLHDPNNKKSISSDFVTSIIRLPNNEFWIGTEGGGVCKVLNSDTKPEFLVFSEQQGLSNNVVKSVTYDNNYNLWVTTNIGLNKINILDLSIRNYTKEDGLPFEDFSYASIFLNNGLILISGLDGFSYFNPNKIKYSGTLPNLEFEDFKIFNKSILPEDVINNRVLLKDRLEDSVEIELKHNENVFSIELTSLHFSNPENHKLRYRLMPINNDWIEVNSNQKTIQYNGLQSGNYELEVMASDASRNWTKPKKIKINILPIFWKTNLAYSLYILFIILTIYLVGRVIFKIQSLNHKVEIEKIKIKSVKEVNTAKLRFFSNISHDLKTPLTLIMGPVNMLLEQFSYNSEAQDRLQIIKRQSKKIAHLINQVHDFQKAEANTLKMNYSRFSFNKFIQELNVDFGFMAKNENKKLEINCKEKNIFVSADRDKLEKVFNNILSNAFKYTERNDIIRIEYKSEEKDLILTISDTGRGIDSADLEYVFEQFYQSKKYANIHSSGSGIGLAFSKLLVEMHYGYISAESELNLGTIIHIRLPIVKAQTTEDLIEVENEILLVEKEFNFKRQLNLNKTPDKIKVDSNFSGTLIFYVEDDLDMRMFVSKELSKFFKLKSFNNGQECLDAMDDEWPDLIISDIQMPELNGLDLCRKVKTDMKTSHIPIILLTALTNIEDKMQGIKDGADAYIKKPFNLQHLVTRTEALLNNRKQLRERYQIGISLTKDNNLNNRNDNAFLEKLYNLMEENLGNQNLDLNSFSKELYLNRTHFYQKVKALTNQTPFELLKEYRLKKAAELLVHKKLPVIDVFLMTGFKSNSHFTKEFKKKYNTTPGKYASDVLKRYSTKNS